MTKAAGYGGGEIRQWIAAAAAGHAAGIKRIGVDYYSAETKLAVGVGVASGVAVAVVHMLSPSRPRGGPAHADPPGGMNATGSAR